MTHLLLRRWSCAQAERAVCKTVTAAAHRRGVAYILGIETSCDDTAAAVLDGDGNVLSNVISSQWELNAKWKGACNANVFVQSAAVLTMVLALI